ncbi:MAG: chromosome segregation SMC family protein [Hyphomicrobiaceae bacterium]
MQIARLRLLGFKSFVEPTELLIEKGLTGVVGPNGCGKSNLLEALRWVMGEASYKSMRASTMEDVIFSGTTSRPGRNWAEVTIFVDNSARQAPAEFNDSDELEVTRRIERELGSAYRINGSEARARDVKILFEDAATGARSPSLVRQGQIGEIVNAKPEQRRRILEDAAGVAGLHSRRHEAELRLKAAETNLARLNDVLGQLAGQVESLKRQARQARRYKEISGEIRANEALLLHLAWTAAQADVDYTEAMLADTLSRVAEAAQQEAVALREEADRAEALDPLREEEARRGAAIARLKIEQDTFEKEADRLAQRQRELEGRVEQLTRDIERENELVREAHEIVARLNEEDEALAATSESEAVTEEEARGKLTAGTGALEAAEATLANATRRAFEARARRQSLEAAHRERSEQIEKLSRQAVALEAQAREAAAKAPDAEKLAITSEKGQQLLRDISEIEAQTIAAEERVLDLAAEVKLRQEASETARFRAGQLTTEVETLFKLLKPAREDGLPPIVDQLRVQSGYEMALGAALGDDLDAPIGEEAPMHWRRIDMGLDDPALPNGAVPLAGMVEAPPELARRLKQIGIVAHADGKRLQSALKPGQRLVSLEGDLWRWDGFVAAAHAPTAAAQRLAERNRLGEIEGRQAAARDEAEDLASAQRTTAELHRVAEAEERRLRQLWRDTQSELARVRETLTVIERQARETESRLAAIGEARSRVSDGLEEARQKAIETEAALAAMPANEGLESELADAERATAEARTLAADARALVTSLERDRQMRSNRRAALATERERWQTRSQGADQQIATLNERKTEAETELASLADLPAKVEVQRGKILSELTDAERLRQTAADALAAADTAHREAQKALRTIQATHAAERESRARNEARLEAARQKRSEEARKIADTMGCEPQACLALAGLAPDAEMPELAEVDRKLQRLKADRERLGSVNLTADEDLTRITEQHASMDMERLDVEQAINKLRGAIGHLNREARSRLREAFQSVNAHFVELFSTLFGGGEARLEMVESEEDPLEGGLEIVAKPPGKKPATISLLSGGEQTLTALSLIFAVFLTNPSPICVLDEVDAPLDDANVDRFCTLMEKMAAETETRFLVITHHPMTMARMNRLFGVTMAEKGVSQLVSVDLATAERIIENGGGHQQAAG